MQGRKLSCRIALHCMEVLMLGGTHSTLPNLTLCLFPFTVGCATTLLDEISCPRHCSRMCHSNVFNNLIGS
jgi:hypothetical protein